LRGTRQPKATTCTASGTSETESKPFVRGQFVDVPDVVGAVVFGDASGWQCREFGERRVLLDNVNHAGNDYRTRQVRIVDSVPDEPTPVIGVDDHTNWLRTVEHGSLDDRAEFRWEPCVLEREGQLAER